MKSLTSAQVPWIEWLAFRANFLADETKSSVVCLEVGPAFVFRLLTEQLGGWGT